VMGRVFARPGLQDNDTVWHPNSGHIGFPVMHGSGFVCRPLTHHRYEVLPINILWLLKSVQNWSV
jgi:hypothetical protein